MLLHEIIARKDYLDLKLVDLECYITKLETLNIKGKGNLYNDVISEKFALLNKIKSHEILIYNLCKSNYVTISNSEITLHDAKALLDTSIEKIETFDDVIANGDMNHLDFFSLLNQRDSLFEEYIILYNTVKISESSVKWINKEEKE